MFRVAVVAFIGLAFAVVQAETGQRRRSSPLTSAQQFLATEFQFGVVEFRDLARRTAVARTLEAVDGREVVTVGAVIIAAPASFYAKQLLEVVAFKRESSAVQQIGAFSIPATTDDAANLSLDGAEAARLKACRPSNCGVQLSADAIARVTRALSGPGTDVKPAAERVLREVLADLVNSYREHGDAALMTYLDADEPVSVAAEFHAMIRSPPAVLKRFPALYRHVVDFPSAPSAGTIEDVVYWSKEKMGPAVIVSITHLAILRLQNMPSATFAAASKQIYGSHYFDASLGITILLDASRGENAPRTVLVYVNRSRIDALSGFWGGVKRAIVRSRTRSSVSSSLEEARDLVESRFRASQATTR